ncbi:winged helix-turn-helix domain-containing protein [Brevibacillus ruminantium]|uniref:Winged helix-turn-helix domain-containing protein n=1 Tax=Brevibacillus ruminantium TaxID=2950604 RepID=A0ABY4WFQ8_9BACL|nr:winged helix-turn-helix domain-containing protein [Brevibacillus ruminantium]USG64847.1 winged helix-turn-helix domain-containing protein [Brevibacillus ruminantium]
MLQFDDGSYQVSWGSECITLLPKEYVLFHFLFHHRNQAFRREELLDRVWGLEMPTDRTVDDHVYRLRKKLQAWQHLLAIDTVRGFGYRLTWKESRRPNLLEDNPEFASHAKQLFQTYHGLGMGAAMQTLSANKDVLGFSIDPFYEVYLRFVSGDFGWFLKAEDVPLEDRLFYLVHLYLLIEEDKGKAIALCQKVLSEQEKLPGLWGVELEINLITLYVTAERWQEAAVQMEKVEKLVAEIRSHSYTLTYLFQTIFYLLSKRELSPTREKLEEAKKLLAEKPMQREQGTLLVLEGMLCYLQGDRSNARRLLDEGVEVLQETRFVPHYLYAVYKIEHFFRSFSGDSVWQAKYQKEWARLKEKYQFLTLHRQLEKRLGLQS